MNAQTSFKSHRYHVLDGMRGIAAILVMFYHFYSAKSLPILRNTFVAVDFFFILSGFVIYHAYGSRLLEGLRWQVYLSGRIARLFPMAAAGLSIGFFPLLALVRSGHADYSNIALIVSFGANLLMLPYLNTNSKFFSDHQSVTGQTFPADDPLWSIFVELFASLLFLGLIRLRPHKLFRICVGSLVVLWVFAYINARFIGGFVVDMDMGWNTQSFIGAFPRVCFGFCCGMLLYINKAKMQTLQSTSHPLLASLLRPWPIYLLLVGILIFPFPLGGLYAAFAISSLAPFLVAAGSVVQVSSSSYTSRASQFLGWISYPIYCLHRPVFGLVALANSSWGNSHIHRLYVPLVSIFLTLLCSIALSRLFDVTFIQRKCAALLVSFFRMPA